MATRGGVNFADIVLKTAAKKLSREFKAQGIDVSPEEILADSEMTPGSVNASSAVHLTTGELERLWNNDSGKNGFPIIDHVLQSPFWDADFEGPFRDIEREIAVFGGRRYKTYFRAVSGARTTRPNF
jgi:hypothetical protein